jgi:hypothetical protein
MTTMIAEAQNAVQSLLAGYGLAGKEALTVLRNVGERFTQEVESPSTAFELVRLRSLGLEQDILAEEGGAISDAEFAHRLHLKSRQTVHNYREAGKLFALPKGARNFVYPAWQIHRGALLRGLEAVLKELQKKRMSPSGTALFFLTPAEALEGKRPLDLLRQGETEDVLLHAQRYGVIGS